MIGAVCRLRNQWSTSELKKPDRREYVPTELGKLSMGENEKSFQERLSAFADDERKKAKRLPPGPERELALRKIRQAETASDMDGWANSAASQPER
jgi:hypothetical protein